MSEASIEEQTIPVDAAAGEATAFEETKASLPVRKRKKEDDSAAASGDGEDDDKYINKKNSREIRLEQNRKAARESRRRKKNMYVRESLVCNYCNFICILTFLSPRLLSQD